MAWRGFFTITFLKPSLESVFMISDTLDIDVFLLIAINIVVSAVTLSDFNFRGRSVTLNLCPFTSITPLAETENSKCFLGPESMETQPARQVQMISRKAIVLLWI